MQLPMDRLRVTLLKLTAGLLLITGFAHVQGILAQSDSQSGSHRSAEIPPSSRFEVPAPNECQSNYDRFYEAEPGVYAYWALCEKSSPIQIYDYAGHWDLTAKKKTWGAGSIRGGAPGPVTDGETAASGTGADFVQNQDILMNTHQGTIAGWVNAAMTSSDETALALSAVGHHSAVSIGLAAADTICFTGSFTNAENAPYSLRKCGYAADSWHRVAFTWNNGTEQLYVDGIPVSEGHFTGNLDNRVFYYKLFPGCCAAAGKMTLAKMLVANQAWSAAEVARDFAPVFPPVPAGGVYVSASQLGTIHRDVLGYADNNQDISTTASLSALKAGLAQGGFTAVRYAGGYAGINADESNWHGGTTCVYGQPGATAPAQNNATNDKMDVFIPAVAQKLKLHIGYTVNYGSNPPACNAGGDPLANGASLVQYTNIAKHYGIKYWEIGNELFSKTTELDFHPNPNTGSSYAAYEPAFYDAMKAADPTIKIAVPIALNVYSWTTKYSLPVVASARYDAIVYHHYPLIDPITDGATLYPERVASNVQLRGGFSALQTSLLNAGKSPEAIWVTEWNDEMDGDFWSKQTMGAVMPLFVVTQLAEYMQAGVEYATWWEQGMTGVCSADHYDKQGDSTYNWWKCGNTSLIYTGQRTAAHETEVGLKMGDLAPAARGFQILSQSGFVTEGEHMVRTHSDVKNAPWLLSYAATHDKSFAVILINRDRDQSHIVPVRLEGIRAGASVKQWTYGRAQYDQTRRGNWAINPTVSTHGAWTGEFSATLPAWSVNVLVFRD